MVVAKTKLSSSFRIEPAGDGSKVLVHTNLTLSGAVAQYGRGVGMIQATATALMNQFAGNLKRKIADPSSTQESKPIGAASLAGKVAWNTIKDKLGGKPSE